MVKGYTKTAGRLSVRFVPEYGDNHAVSVACVSGWNDSCPSLEHVMSVEEARDLRYMLDRAISHAEGE